MRLRLLFCTVCCITLAACLSQNGSARLSPEEVLQKAADATQTLRSAQYVAQGNFDAALDAWLAEGTVRMNGSLNDAGEQLHFQVDVMANIRDGKEEYTAQGNLEVSLLSRDEVYMNVHSLSSEPPNAIFRPEVLRNLTDRWWLLPPGDTPPEAVGMTPDPRLLQIQSQVVTVSKNRGMETIEGRETYHYDVTLDPEKLLEYLSTLAAERGEAFDAAKVRQDLSGIKASGELWIDAGTFYMQKISWNVQQIPIEGGGTASASVTITFRNHNTAPDLEPPAGAMPFSPAIFFTLPDDAIFPEEIPAGGATGLDEANIEDILRSLE